MGVVFLVVVPTEKYEKVLKSGKSPLLRFLSVLFHLNKCCEDSPFG
jgi:hypothetical protein